MPRDAKDDRYSGHVGVPNKRNKQNSFVYRKPARLPLRQAKTLYDDINALLVTSLCQCVCIRVSPLTRKQQKAIKQ